MKHINIALFVPHAGCPHQCCFCNQKSISGSTEALKPQEVPAAVETALNGREKIDAELAFFGGSFTAIERGYMISLLEQTRPYTENGIISGIRISTRPDAVDREVLDILKKYGVTSIELGCQSMDDGVLKLSNRGHTAADVENACALIKEYGFSLGVQMMTGLPGDTDEKCIETAKKLISLKPDTCRIYPTAVLENTPLADMLRNGEYQAQTTDGAVKLCAVLLKMFCDADIPVIRLGLHSGGNVEDGYIAGAYHPAFRELCEGEIFYREIAARVTKNTKTVYVPKGKTSPATGHGRRNMKSFEEAGFHFVIREDSTLLRYDIRIDEETK
ncbi:MAG: radical SAM protein [Clostridia bacterium]|nr:radical SAM protein [Clostridia bacterium]